MFKSFAFGIMATLMLVFATAANANPLLYGNWTSVQNQGDFSFTMLLGVEEKQSSLAVTCAYQGQSLTASVTVPSEVTDRQIILKGSASDEKQVGNLNCSVDAVPMSFDYVLKADDILELTAQGQTAVFNRVK